jgi:hypothetical protein
MTAARRLLLLLAGINRVCVLGGFFQFVNTRLGPA